MYKHTYSLLLLCHACAPVFQQFVPTCSYKTTSLPLKERDYSLLFPFVSTSTRICVVTNLPVNITTLDSLWSSWKCSSFVPVRSEGTWAFFSNQIWVYKCVGLVHKIVLFPYIL